MTAADPLALHTREGRLLALAGAADTTPRTFLERLVAEGHSLPRADLSRLLREWPGGHTLDEAVLNGADLAACRAVGLLFRRAQLRGAILRNANFRLADISDADLSGAILDGAGFQKCVGHRLRLGTVPRPFGTSARHFMRPEMDEFVPFDRALCRTTDFAEADLRWARINAADFSNAALYRTDLRHARIERTAFTDAFFSHARLDGCRAYRNELTSPSLHKATARGAVFRSNIYAQMPGVPQIADAGFRFPRQMIAFLREEWHQRRDLPRAIRIDHDRMIAIRILVLLLMPVLVSLAWHSIESAPGVSTALAIGAVSVFAARRYVTMIFQAVFSTFLSRLNDAEGALRAGNPIASLAILFLPGLATERLTRRRRRRRRRPPSDRAAP